MRTHDGVKEAIRFFEGEDLVSTYDIHMNKTNHYRAMSTLIERIAQRLKPSRLLDVGTGTGMPLIYFLQGLKADILERVDSLDLLPDVLHLSMNLLLLSLRFWEIGGGFGILFRVEDTFYRLGTTLEPLYPGDPLRDHPLSPQRFTIHHEITRGARKDELIRILSEVDGFRLVLNCTRRPPFIIHSLPVIYKNRETGLGLPLNIHQGDLLNPPLRGGYDLILASYIFHWLPDKEGGARAIHDLLANDGIFVSIEEWPLRVTDWEDREFVDELRGKVESNTIPIDSPSLISILSSAGLSLAEEYEMAIDDEHSMYLRVFKRA